MKDEIKKKRKEKIKREEERKRKQQKAHFAGRAVKFIPGGYGTQCIATVGSIWRIKRRLTNVYVRDRVSLALPRHVGPISITNIECDAVIPLSVIT